MCEVDLSGLFTKAIAQRDGIPEERVTASYIHEQRERKIYPNARFDPRGAGLTCLTRN